MSNKDVSSRDLIIDVFNIGPKEKVTTNEEKKNLNERMTKEIRKNKLHEADKIELTSEEQVEVFRYVIKGFPELTMGTYNETWLTPIRQALRKGVKSSTIVSLVKKACKLKDMNVFTNGINDLLNKVNESFKSNKR